MTDNPVDSRRNNITPARDFQRFPDCPPEIRFKIWENALTATCTWTLDAAGFRPIGNRPYLVGSANQEAQQILIETYGRPVLTRHGRAVRTCWIYFPNTVIHLNGHETSPINFKSFTDDFCSRIMHVGITWYEKNYGEILLRRLGNRCENLETVILREPAKVNNTTIFSLNKLTYEHLTVPLASVFDSALDYNTMTDFQLNDRVWANNIVEGTIAVPPPSKDMGVDVTETLHYPFYTSYNVGCTEKRNRFHRKFLKQLPKIHFLGGKTALLDIRTGSQWEMSMEWVWVWFVGPGPLAMRTYPIRGYPDLPDYTEYENAQPGETGPAVAPYGYPQPDLSEFPLAPPPSPAFGEPQSFPVVPDYGNQRVPMTAHPAPVYDEEPLPLPAHDPSYPVQTFHFYGFYKPFSHYYPAEKPIKPSPASQNMQSVAVLVEAA